MTAKNFTPFPVLETERLTLRRLISNDDKEIFALRSDDNVNKYLDRKQSKSINDARNFIRIINENAQRNNSIYWAITLNGTNRLIGTICLFDFSEDNLKAEIGYELFPGFQGKGIMQEAASKVIDFAFKRIGLNLIAAYTHCENQRSTRLLEVLNFEGHHINENNIITFKLKRKG